MTKAPFIVIAALLCAAAAQAKPVPLADVAPLQKQWMAANRECRGGNHEPDDAICRKRDALELDLERKGWCWAYSDFNVMPMDYRWHDCRKPRP